MKLPNLSNSNAVAEWRYIQSLHETNALKNPDSMVQRFIPFLQRWHCRWVDRKKLATLRSYPFYYYLVARTKYYDGIFVNSISNDVRRIINVGCGSDTRAYRFKKELRDRQIKVLECDQEEAISAKRHAVRHWGVSDFVSYLPLDLNKYAWPDLIHWLAEDESGKVLVLIEGVSPYIDFDTFECFLRLLVNKLPDGSRIAYDFKLKGVADDFGRNGRSAAPFRLPMAEDEVAAYHQRLGFRIDHMESSSALSTRMLPDLERAGAALFNEDGLLQLSVGRH